jgi:phosphate-selective porin OprO and OprP
MADKEITYAIWMWHWSGMAVYSDLSIPFRMETTGMKHREIVFLLSFLVLPAGLCFGQQAKNLDKALAGGTGLPAQGTGIEQRMAKMEDVLKQQNQEIETLRKQLVTQEDGKLNKAKANELRAMIKDILSDEKFRNEIYQPTLQAGYDHGFFIRTADDAFYMKTRIATQFRYIGQTHQDRDMNRPWYQDVPVHDRNAFEFARARIYFNGWLWDKNLTYWMFLENSTHNGDLNVKQGDIFFNYQYAKDQNVKWGQFLLPFGKQGVQSGPFNSQFIDYSISQQVFNPGQSLGVAALGDVLNKKLSYTIGAFNGVKNSQDDSFALDSQMALVARSVYHILPGYDAIEETDLAFHEKPAWDVGASFLYNQNDGDIGATGNGRNGLAYAVQDLIRAGRGGYGTSPDRGTKLIQFGADTGFKYKGFSFSAEWYLRNVDSDHEWSAWNRLTEHGQGTSTCQGGYLQAGYFVVPKKLEVAARLGGVWGLGDDQCMEETLGVNYYLKGQALKLSADVTHMDEIPVTSRIDDVTQNDNKVWMYRLQIQAVMN